MKNNFHILLLSLFSIFTSADTNAQTYKSSMTVTVRMYEQEPQTTTIIPETQVGDKKLAPPLWKVKDTLFQERAKEFKELPHSSDTANSCPRNNVMIEYVENNKTLIKLSCYNTSNGVRKKYVQFARKIK